MFIKNSFSIQAFIIQFCIFVGARYRVSRISRINIYIAVLLERNANYFVFVNVVVAPYRSLFAAIIRI